MLTQDELIRYDRQIMLSEIGEEGQEKLKKAQVFIAGAGGIGSSVALYLAAAGVGIIRIIDCDIVELSNLNRQTLHWHSDIGKAKTASAKKKLSKLNPDIKIEGINKEITETNVSGLVSDSDLIIDALDNLPTRFLLNKTAVEKNIPFFHGAIYGFEGRVMTVIPGKTACLRCIYHGVMPGEKFPVIGVAPAFVGVIQATEVIKYITGIGEMLTNKLLVYDGL